MNIRTLRHRANVQEITSSLGAAYNFLESIQHLRGSYDLAHTLHIIKELSFVIQALSCLEELPMRNQYEGENDDNHDKYGPSQRGSVNNSFKLDGIRVYKRHLLQELGIWCYLAFQNGAQREFLYRARACLCSVARTGDYDSSLMLYYAFVLWGLIQQGSATEVERKICVTLLDRYTKDASRQAHHLGSVWFRLGWLYRRGVGCAKNPAKSQRCFARARAFGLDCSFFQA